MFDSPSKRIIQPPAAVVALIVFMLRLLFPASRMGLAAGVYITQSS